MVCHRSTNPNATEGALDFTEQDRHIFDYFDGVAVLKGDPLEIFDRMVHLLGCHPNQVTAQIGKVVAKPQDDGTTVYETVGEVGLPALEASRKFCEAIDMAFEMTPFDKTSGLGATKAIRFAAWKALCDFLQKKNQNAELWPTS